MKRRHYLASTGMLKEGSLQWLSGKLKKSSLFKIGSVFERSATTL